MVFAAAFMLSIVGVDLVAVAPGYWWIVGDVLLAVGMGVFAVMVKNS